MKEMTMRGAWFGVLAIGLLTVATLTARQAPRAVSASDAEARAAATKAMALLQQSMSTWEGERACASCHHQHLPLALMRTARQRGVAFDVQAATRTATRLARPAANLDFAVQAVLQIDPSLDTGSWLNSLTDVGVRPTLATQVFARRVLNRQTPDGSWTTTDVRPPQSYSRVTATAVAVRAIQTYLPAALDAERRAVTHRASQWLRAAIPADTEEQTFQVLGLSWAGVSPATLQPQVRALVAAQRRDGGWAQLPRLESDAYATGQVLVALQRAGGLPASHQAVRRGLTWLLSQQRPEGSWLVETRLHEQDLVSPPYFETGFPHGKHQIASAMGTTYAAMALLESLPVSAPDATVLDSLEVDTSADQAWMSTALFGTTDELGRLLDQGMSANSRTPAGTTALMMAAHDPGKVSLLLERGADVAALSDARHNALMVSANHLGSLGAMRLLLDKGASPEEPPAPPGYLKHHSPMLYAISSGETAKVELLMGRGAKLPRRVSLLGGEFALTPLELAIFQRDEPMARLLVRGGASANELGETGISPLTQAVFCNDTAMVKALIALGADLNLVDQNGETALMHAALVDFGDTRVIEALLAAGARRDVTSPDKRTALDLARQYGHVDHARQLE
ncbi:MAG: ankyrin repeat domain-containing protein [Vicinamibacteria bacterium]|nr:ankyrin repeat domain-containing protein [Vicinamibacteria bacterium]